jgi:PAS domain S-box-containing protein
MRCSFQSVRSQALFETLYEFSPDAIVVSDPEGVIGSINAQVERVFGYAREELLGQPVEILIPERFRSMHPGHRQSFNTRASVRLMGIGLELYGRRKDGTEFPADIMLSPVETAEGRVMLSVIRDITERKQSDQTALAALLIQTQDDERRRFARELHDSVGQGLISVRMGLDSLRRPEATEKECQLLMHITDTLDKCLTETRTISYLLHPPLLDEVGLFSAARWYVEGFSERSGVQVNLNIPNDLKRLSAALELSLFRILQESLVNVHRHSHCKSVDVKLELGTDEIALEVRDYGEGMPSELLERFRAAGGGRGVGLRSMRERISELGGRFEIQSDKTGTLIRVTAPVKKTGLSARNAGGA